MSIPNVFVQRPFYLRKTEELHGMNGKMHEILLMRVGSDVVAWLEG